VTEQTVELRGAVNGSTGWFGAVVLNRYGAPGLSELTKCGAPPLDELSHQLKHFVLNDIFIRTYHDIAGRLILMFGRRLQNAVSEYIAAREILLTYLQKLPQTNNHFLQAMAATTHFEQCIASACEAAKLLHRMAELAKLPKADDEREKRLTLIWNRSKHFDEDIGNTSIANDDISAPVWLTNEKICCSKSDIDFTGLHSFLTDLHNIFEFLSTGKRPSRG
jgi:hypothetical protein